VSNPAAPTLKGSYDTAGNSWGVAASGNYIYVADRDNGLEIFRMDTPTPIPAITPTPAGYDDIAMAKSIKTRQCGQLLTTSAEQ